MSYSVYKHTFPNGKVYIGITKLVPEYRWGKDGINYLHKTNGRYNQPPMAYAILKYGWENVEHEIVYDGLTKEEAEQKEIELIAEYKSNKIEFGYNIENGGSSTGKMSEETKIKLSKALKGRLVSDETKKKISDAQKGEKHWNYNGHITEKHKEKISNALKGKSCSEETREKMSKAKSGANHPMYGKHRSKETNAKTSKAVRCIETGKEYYSASYAEKETGISNSGILRSCHGKREIAGGYHWEFVDEEEKNKSKTFKSKLKRKIKCVEKNTIYDSITSASNELTILPSSITNALNGRSKTAGGYHWEYINE